jgi:hypothetical protein
VGLKLLILLILVRRILRVFSTGMKIGFDVHVEQGKYFSCTHHTPVTIPNPRTVAYLYSALTV